MKRPAEVPKVAVDRQRQYLTRAEEQWGAGQAGASRANYFLSRKSLQKLIAHLGLYSQDYSYRGASRPVNLFVTELERRSNRAWSDQPISRLLGQARERARSLRRRQPKNAQKLYALLKADDRLQEAVWEDSLPPQERMALIHERVAEFDRVYRDAAPVLGVLHMGPEACERCAGVGVIESYKHIDGGLCYECGGTGLQP